MKILHIADLHIGKVVNGYSMIAEQTHALEQIVSYTNEHKPQCILIAGDVYDKPIPSVESIQTFDNFLTDLVATNTTIFIVAGNHDSPERLGFASRLLANQRIHLCGSFNGSIPCVTLADDHGNINFWLLPYIKPLSVRHFYENEKDHIHTFEDAAKVVFANANVDFSTRNVLISHQYYKKDGQDALRSDSEQDPIGGLDGIDISHIQHFDYVALGHLHRPQSAGFAHIRYCGSPVKYSLSEHNHKKSVSLVTIAKKGDVQIQTLDITPLNDMQHIQGTLEELIALPQSNNYTYITLTNEEELVDPHGKLRVTFPNLMNIEFKNSRTNATINYTSIEEKANLSTFELFSQFFLDRNGSVMTAEQEQIIQELLTEEVSA